MGVLELQPCSNSSYQGWYVSSAVSTRQVCVVVFMSMWVQFTVSLWSRILSNTSDNGQILGINKYNARLQVATGPGVLS